MLDRRPHTNDEATFARLARVKSKKHFVPPPLGPELISFFKQSVEKRQDKFGVIAQAWEVLVPKLFQEHTALDSLTRGTLTVLVDSASHLYELKQLLLAGLQKQLILACKKTGLRKIQLKPGRWYDGDPTRQSLRFS